MLRQVRTLHPRWVRFASKKAEAPKVDQKQVALQREREQKRLQQKRESAKFVSRLRDEARVSLQLPHTMDVAEALRYIRAAEVGRPAHATTISLEMRIVADRGVPKINGTCRLPRPLDEERICVLTGSSELAEQARKAGASLVGSDNIINQIKETGETPFDRVYATPDVMSRVNQIARILGPKGLMPNVKRGTVTNDIFDAVQAARGEMSFKQHDTLLRIPVARASYPDTDIVRNILTVTNSVREMLEGVTSAKKGQIGRTLLTSTASPSIPIQV